MKKLLPIVLLFFSFYTWAQVGINTTTPAAQLEITSSNQAAPANTDGIIIPKIDVFPATNPTAAQQSMMVYLTTVSGANNPGFYYWDNATTTWVGILGKLGWEVSGNTGTIAGTNYIGTADNVDVSIKANALERIRIQSGTGNIGVNTPTPASQLQITASSQANPSNTDGIIIPKVDIFPITNPTAAQQSMLVYLTTAAGVNNTGFYYWDNVTTTWISVSGKVGWGITGNTGTIAGTNYIGTTDANDLVFDTNATERMRIKQTTGNVGIGTTFPSESFQVANNVKIGGSLWSSAATDRVLKFGDGNFVTIGEEFADDCMSLKASKFTFNTGFVGIGTTTPSQKLDVQGGNALINSTYLGEMGFGTGWAGFSHINTANTTGYGLLQVNDGSFTLINKQNTGTGYIGFRVGNLDKMVVANNGNVGIGIAAPIANLHVFNSNNLDVDNTVFIARNNAAAGSTWTMGSVEYYTEGYDNISFSRSISPLDGNGFYDLGRPLSTKYGGYRWGTLYCTSNPNVSSDITLKKEIQPLQYGLDAVRKINPISYIFKTEKLPNGKELDDSDKTKILGFSAQELLQVLPEVVSTTCWITKDEKLYSKQKSETLGVRYGDIIPVAINAVKELDKLLEEKTSKLQEKIQILEVKNNTLKNDIEKLKTEIEKLKVNSQNFESLLQDVVTLKKYISTRINKTN